RTSWPTWRGRGWLVARRPRRDAAREELTRRRRRDRLPRVVEAARGTDNRAVGQEVAARTFSREDRQRYRMKVRANLDVFARMLSEARFHPESRSFGLQ